MKVAHALELAGRKFRVFPLQPNGKRPATSNGYLSATTDEWTIRKWWAADPDFNIGVATGHHFFVVDADCKDNRPGLDSLALLDDMYGLPQSMRVATPSGGVHVYLAKDPDHRLVSNADRVDGFPGIDIRAEGGYVVGPGSTIDGLPYTSDSRGVLAYAPAHFFPLLRKPIATRNDMPAIELDQPHNVAKALDWLVNHAPHAVDGAGGDETTYSVAAELRALGLSQSTALDLMLEHWNEAKASPPWMPDELAVKVENGFSYGQGAPGGKTAEGEFGIVDLGPESETLNGLRSTALDLLEQPNKPPFPLTTATGAASQDLPPRQWLYGYLLSRKYVGILASPGGVGKTAYTFGAAIAMASGQSLLHDMPHKPLKVWLYNLEDDIVELRRRIQAAARHYDADEETLSRIMLTSGRDRPLQLVAQQDGRTLVSKDVQAIIETLKANAIDVLVLDPLVNAHSIPENDNEAAAKLMRVVARIADEANCAIWLVHHTRKGFVAGEADSIRGGSPLVANSRGAHTLAPMTVEEAKLYGVPDDERKRYVKLDDAKANMAISSGRGKWMHLQSVALGNGDTDYPAGDSVQVVVRWTPPQALDGLEHSDIRRMLEAVEAGPGDGERFSIRTQDKDRWAGQMLVDEFGKTVEQAKAFLKTAFEKGWITTEEYVSPAQRKARKGIVVYLANVPEEAISELE